MMNTSRELVVTPVPSSPSPFSVIPRGNDLTIKDLLNVVRRRKAIVIGTLLFFVVVAGVLCAITTRRYKATAIVQVQKEGADSLGLENMMSGGEGAPDALDAAITMQTEAQVLQSESLALRVVNDLGLERNQDFRPKFSPIGWALALLSPPSTPDPKNLPLEDSPSRRHGVLTVFKKNLTVKPVPGTRLIEVSYLNPDPKTAASVVNDLVKGLVDYNFQTRYSATQQVAGWLGNQLSDLRKQTQDLQAKVVQLHRDSGVFTLGDTDGQGRQQIYTPVLDRLQQATTQFTQAQSNRIMKEALYQGVKNGDPESMTGLAASGMLGSAPAGTGNSLVLIQNLRAQEATIQGQFNELSAKFGPGYPKLAEMRANLDGVQASIKAEAARVAQRIRNDYTVAQQVEDGARDVFTREKTEADSLNNKAIEYQIARQEADQSNSLYENLLRRVKEAGVLAGLRSSNITLVDPARVPSRPAKPNPLIYLGAALAGGLFFGACGAFLRDAMDGKIHDLPELQSFLGEAPLGILPYHKPTRALRPAQIGGASSVLANGRTSVTELASLPAFSEPRAAYTEALRTLRTSLMLSHVGVPPKVILVTSSVAGEGKSMLSINLAALLAQQADRKVLLVDGDLRRPVLHRRLNARIEPGLSSILTSKNIEQTAFSTTCPVRGTPGLSLMPAGPVPPYPSELLSSNQMRRVIDLWKQEYDFIVIDASPVLPVTDPVLLSTYADITLLLARFNVTERQSLERSYHLLQAGGAHKIGVVLNAVTRTSSSYHHYYGANYFSYYEGQLHA